MKISANLSLNDVDQIDELITFLENVRANIHLPVQEGASSRSVSLYDGGGETLLSGERVLSPSGESDRTGELPEDERPLLLGSDVSGPTDESVHDRPEEEESAMSKVRDLFIVRSGIIEHLALLDRMKEEGEKLLAENTRLGGLAVREWVEEQLNAE